ncbi:hypothetical protein MUP01_07015, partial [Candidatus Bathyarchaeota archaeon]|nr:hypothetical protein [Candidatus Bathyarchaeota archaeon]
MTIDEVTGDEILDWVLPNFKFNGWGLPSHGIAKDDCGTYGMKACLNVDEHPDGLAVFKPYMKSCFSPKCPTCWNSWAKREANRIERRILHAMKKHPHCGLPIHFMLSVPKSQWHLSVAELRKIAISICIKVGFRGGSLIVHPFRETDDGRWYVSVHFHMIGFGWIECVADEYKSSGWIAKNLGIRKSVFGTAYYQLTHCGVWYGVGVKHSVTWFGDLAYNKLPMPSKINEKCCCPYCGSKIRPVVWI